MGAATGGRPRASIGGNCNSSVVLHNAACRKAQYIAHCHDCMTKHMGYLYFELSFHLRFLACRLLASP